MTTPYSLYTAIPYANGKPHLGHALEFLQADAVARFMRLADKEVYFQIGSDEHGQKIEETALKEGITPKELADRNADLFRATKDTLGITYTGFIQTTEDRHKESAQAIWRKLVAKGDIYQGTYKGLYCVGCEAYKTETELIDGLCPNHNKAPEAVEEVNHFFRLSAYTDRIKQLIADGTLEILPAFRANEILHVLEEGLLDVSFSRPKSSLSWGIPVPDEEDFVMYVWCDALTNYLSGTGYLDNPSHFEKFWPAELQILGKDILRFHAAIWPAMLLSLDLPVPKKLFVHGFITSGGQKMSKSTGNYVEPEELLSTYGKEALRGFFYWHTPYGEDIDFTWEKFRSFYDNDLANNIGNLFNRVLVMANKYTEGKVPHLDACQDPRSLALVQKNTEAFQGFLHHMQVFDFKKAAECITTLATEANRYINEMEPWKKAKETPEVVPEIIHTLLGTMHTLSVLLAPLLPETSAKMCTGLGTPLPSAPFSHALPPLLSAGTPLTAVPYLFEKIEHVQ